MSVTYFDRSEPSKEEMIKLIRSAFDHYIAIFLGGPQEKQEALRQKMAAYLEAYLELLKDERIQVCKLCNLPAFKEDSAEGYCNRPLCKREQRLQRLLQGTWVGPKKRKTRKKTM